MKFNDILISNQIYLKQLLVTDVDEKYINWLNDPIINRYLEVRHNPPTLSQQIKYVSECIKSKNESLLGIYLIQNKLIGTLKLTFLDSLTVEIGIMIGEKHLHGLGIGKSAISLIKKWAVENNFLSLNAGYEAKNIPSAKLFESLGFKKLDIVSKPMLAKPDTIIEKVSFNLTNML